MDKHFFLQKTKINVILLILTLIIALPAQEPIEEYKISVDAVLVPVFAVDRQGNPIFGLNKEDFELVVNEAPTEITELLAVPFYETETITRTKELPKRKSPVPPTKMVERFVFIILDHVFISHAGYRRAKSIAVGIIENAPPHDIFIVLENNPAGGLRYIGGTEKGRKSLINKINKLSVRDSSWSRNLFSMRSWNLYADTDENDPREALSRDFVRLKNVKKAFDRKSYQQQVINFAESLKQLKYALKTVTKPKIVFLISEGIAKASYIDGLAHYDPTGVAILKDERTVREIKYFYQPLYFQRLREMIKAINDGGSVLYTINPGKPRADEASAGDASLQYMAAEGGGRYFSGMKTDKIISHVQRSTAAYYELAFIIKPGSTNDSGKLNIKIKCKKPGVVLHSFERTERGKAYHEMSKVEKQLFAFNVATGGSWSRMVGKVVRIKYKKYKQDKPDDPNKIAIEIQLPEAMKNRKLDIHVLHYDPKTNKTKIDFETKVVEKNVFLVIESKQDSSDFFVAIDPANVHCIYNEVK